RCCTTLLPFASLLFLNASATSRIYTLSLHDALPISRVRATRHQEGARVLDHQPAGLHGDGARRRRLGGGDLPLVHARHPGADAEDRKSTRLNSSHVEISYAVFCLKKKSTYTIRMVSP